MTEHMVDHPLFDFSNNQASNSITLNLQNELEKKDEVNQIIVEKKTNYFDEIKNSRNNAETITTGEKVG